MIQPLPTEPGLYYDCEGRAWFLHLTGAWEDFSGRIRPINHNPALVLAGPFAGPVSTSEHHTETSTTL